MKVDLIRLQAIELLVPDKGDLSWTEIVVEPDVVDQLRARGFQHSGPLEFNLYDAGLVGPETE